MRLNQRNSLAAELMRKRPGAELRSCFFKALTGKSFQECEARPPESKPIVRDSKHVIRILADDAKRTNRRGEAPPRNYSGPNWGVSRSEEHTSELQSLRH